jgi:hypothetical protein
VLNAGAEGADLTLTADWTSAAHAADAVGANDIDLIPHVLHAGKVPYGLLDQLLQVESWQPAAQEERFAAVLDS